ncbi:type II toxin-antitoxin system HicB family antitoxin [Halomonas sp. PR-M31]|uniref:type II toxin-antitoxin system HicB family antitoxin n=1 Tax=Halomonas sp. PR-M31 TaxID=1471202 RepID=UPI0009E2AF27|nr:type II toxin-antitoxin system HicB family antitoxin [Halomonas sp. PR-M31]
MNGRSGFTWQELEAAFREAVDDYLATCEDLDETPETPCKGSFNVRIGHELHLAAAVAASQQGISLNDLTRQALDGYLQQHP